MWRYPVTIIGDDPAVSGSVLVECCNADAARRVHPLDFVQARVEWSEGTVRRIIWPRGQVVVAQDGVVRVCFLRFDPESTPKGENSDFWRAMLVQGRDRCTVEIVVAESTL